MTKRGLGIVGGSAFMLAGAVLAAGFRYLFQILVARWLGAADFGTISNLFSWVLTLVGFLCSGTAVAITRFISQREAQEKESSSIIRGGLIIEGVLLGGLVLVGLIFRRSLSQHLFAGSETLLVIMIGAVIGQGMLVVLHGVIKGFRRFRLTAILLPLLPVVRLGLAGVLALLLGYGVSGASWAVFLAPLPVLVLAIYWTYRVSEGSGNGDSTPMPLRELALFALPATIMTGIERFIPRSGTILLNLLATEDVATMVGLFTAALTLTRVPELLLEAMSGPVLSNFSRAEALSDHRRLQQYVTRTLAALGACLGAYVIVLPLVAPRLIPLVYGRGFSYPQFDLFLLSLGTALYFAAKLIRQFVLVNKGATYVARIWALGAAVLLLGTLLLPLDLLKRVEVAYILSNGVVAALLTRSALRAS